MHARSVILIAGPSGVGKSHFIESLGTAAGQELASALGISLQETFELLHAKDAESHPLNHERVFVHYDITRPWNQGFPFDYAREPVLARLSNAESLAIVTLWVPREHLVARFRERHQRACARLLLKATYVLPRRWRHRSASILKLYRDRVEYSRMYSCWFRFCQSLPCEKHWLLDYNDAAPIVHPVIAL